jgi:hypothetical protein
LKGTHFRKSGEERIINEKKRIIKEKEIYLERSKRYNK